LDAWWDFNYRLAQRYKDNDLVIFGIMNEPNTMPTELWIEVANEGTFQETKSRNDLFFQGIDAIRSAGAENLIMVPGNAWTGAWSWNLTWYAYYNAIIPYYVIISL
jgi:endoglucanase